MQVEYGKRYYTVGGDLVRIISVDRLDSRYHFIGMVETEFDKFICCYDGDGNPKLEFNWDYRLDL